MLPRIGRAFIAAVILATTVSAQTAVPSASTSQLTTTFWNVQWFPGRRPTPSWREENRQIRAVHSDLALFHSDLIAFEEVRDLEYAAVAIRSLPGFKVDVCSNFPPREGQQRGQQIAIASRLQPIGVWTESWKRERGGAMVPPRGFVFAAYQLAPRQLLLVYALHLKSNRGEVHEDMSIREESMRQLLSHAKAMQVKYEPFGDLTWVAGGDFNTSPDEPRFAGEKTIPSLLGQGFQWGWRDTPLLARITVNADARHPAAFFDQIFYRGATLTKAWVTMTSPQSSDHRAVNATFAFR